MPPAWLTSPLVAGCALDVAAAVAFVVIEINGGLEAEVVAGGLLGAIEFLHLLGIIVRFNEGNGNWIAGLTKAERFSDCAELGSYVLAHEPLPQSLDSSQSVPLPQEHSLAGQRGLDGSWPRALRTCSSRFRSLSWHH